MWLTAREQNDTASLLVLPRAWLRCCGSPAPRVTVKFKADMRHSVMGVTYEGTIWYDWHIQHVRNDFPQCMRERMVKIMHLDMLKEVAILTKKVECKQLVDERASAKSWRMTKCTISISHPATSSSMKFIVLQMNSTSRGLTKKCVSPVTWSRRHPCRILIDLGMAGVKISTAHLLII